ncbi:Alanine racemase [Campylobacter geochelonis]|uniref:Alanine racemase n=2 Tax=Campylobacter geochelonis TaxID=1780362 RepID=A0A128EJW4_9BACT|nr:alanine racemase [Campylobacter geochelonis]CZE49209.1 Alanine racemase [Campylobacter geochelonis]
MANNLMKSSDIKFVTWAEINLDNLKHNFLLLKSFLSPKTKYCGVVKANAYGHGSVEISRFYEKIGADYLAVARLEEGLELRENGIKLPIILLGYTDTKNCQLAAKNGIELSVFSYEMAKDLSEILGENQVKVHIKLDTGMSRIGFVVNDESSANLAISEIEKISNLKNIKIVGLFTHFAQADDDEFRNLQLKRYKMVADKLDIYTKHVSNSIAMVGKKECEFDMVRAGICAYGFLPAPNLNLDLKTVMSLKTTVANVKTLPPNSPISYGCTYHTSQSEKIATISIGYADGFLRSQKEPKVLISGVLCDVVGRVCMDQCMVKVPNELDVKMGDEVVIFGDGLLSATDVAKRWESIDYEVVCAVSRRVARVYKEGEKVVKVVEYLV